jgi:hypothetical protein
VRLLLALQALYLALAAWLFAPGPRALRLRAAGVSRLPHGSTSTTRAFASPNQTPWRTIGMALALAILALSSDARGAGPSSLRPTSGGRFS